jgi:hypothetical protein
MSEDGSGTGAYSSFCAGTSQRESSCRVVAESLQGAGLKEYRRLGWRPPKRRATGSGEATDKRQLGCRTRKKLSGCDGLGKPGRSMPRPYGRRLRGLEGYGAGDYAGAVGAGDEDGLRVDDVGREVESG